MHPGVNYFKAYKKYKSKYKTLTQQVGGEFDPTLVPTGLYAPGALYWNAEKKLIYSGIEQLSSVLAEEAAAKQREQMQQLRLQQQQQQQPQQRERHDTKTAAGWEKIAVNEFKHKAQPFTKSDRFFVGFEKDNDQLFIESKDLVSPALSKFWKDKSVTVTLLGGEKAEMTELEPFKLSGKNYILSDSVNERGRYIIFEKQVLDQVNVKSTKGNKDPNWREWREAMRKKYLQ